MGAIEFIHKRVVAERDSGVAVLIVSTELDEVAALSDRIVVMYRGRIVGIVPPDTPRGVLGLMMAGVPLETALQSSAAHVGEDLVDEPIEVPDDVVVAVATGETAVATDAATFSAGGSIPAVAQPVPAVAEPALAEDVSPPGSPVTEPPHPPEPPRAPEPPGASAPVDEEGAE